MNLATAMKTTHESLYRSLGIDDSKGIDIEKWTRTIEGALGKLESMERGREKQEIIEIEIIGKGTAEQLLQDAVEKYLHKPTKLAEEEPKEILIPPPEESEDERTIN